MTYVVNAIGTADEECPRGYADWLDFWERKTGKKASYCRHCKSHTTKLCGGHVQLAQKGIDGNWRRVPGYYIVPICFGCNNANNNEIFDVDPGDLVKL